MSALCSVVRLYVIGEIVISNPGGTRERGIVSERTQGSKYGSIFTEFFDYNYETRKSPNVSKWSGQINETLGINIREWLKGYQ